MSSEQLKFSSGLSTLRINDLHDGNGGIVVHIDSGMNSLMATIDLHQAHLLFLYLQERLERR